MTELHLVTDGVWETSHDFRLMRLFPLGHRMTVLRLPGGDLAVHSPIPWSEPLAAALARLGEVTHLLAPSTMHNLWLAPWVEHHPDATFWAVPGLAEKNPGLEPDAMLETGAEIDGLWCRTIEGMPRIQECVVLHEASRTLVVADLLFHFPHSDSRALRMLLKMVGAYGRPAVSRLFRSFVRDPAALHRSLDEVFARGFDRIVVGHGELIERDATRALREAWPAS